MIIWDRYKSVCKNIGADNKNNFVTVCVAVADAVINGSIACSKGILVILFFSDLYADE